MPCGRGKKNKLVALWQPSDSASSRWARRKKKRRDSRFPLRGAVDCVGTPSLTHHRPNAPWYAYTSRDKLSKAEKGTRRKRNIVVAAIRRARHSLWPWAECPPPSPYPTNQGARLLLHHGRPGDKRDSSATSMPPTHGYVELPERTRISIRVGRTEGEGGTRMLFCEGCGCTACRGI
jgi:hypothetical protein